MMAVNTHYFQEASTSFHLMLNVGNVIPGVTDIMRRLDLKQNSLTSYGDKDKHGRINHEKLSKREETMQWAFVAALACGAATIAGTERASVSRRMSPWRRNRRLFMKTT